MALTLIPSMLDIDSNDTVRTSFRLRFSENDFKLLRSIFFCVRIYFSYSYTACVNTVL
jgi:hypothetical protein|nr:MAG TPA: hypothetical protein [Caudoviricetes sp.]